LRIELGDIPPTIQISINHKIAIETMEETTITGCVERTASGAAFTAVSGIDLSSSASLSLTLIGEEFLQLVECPTVQPVVHTPSSVVVSYSFEGFHYQHVSCMEFFYDVFADVMVCPCHETSLFTRQGFKPAPSGASAFGLEFAAKETIFGFDSLDLSTAVESGGAGYCEVVYADINPNSVSYAVMGFHVFSNNHTEKEFTFNISQISGAWLPVKILPEMLWDTDRNLNSSTYARKAYGFGFECETTSIITDSEVLLENGFASFGLLNGLQDLTRLVSATTNKLCGELTAFTNLVIGEVMELELVIGSFVIARISDYLSGARIRLHGLYQEWIENKFDFYHRVGTHGNLFDCKHINGGIMADSSTCLKAGVSSATIL
jgi:hypothetical protein